MSLRGEERRSNPYFGRAPAAPLRSTAGSGVPQLAAARPPHDGGFDKPFDKLRAAQPPSLRWLASQLLHALTRAPCGRLSRLAGGPGHSRGLRQFPCSCDFCRNKSAPQNSKKSNHSDKNLLSMFFVGKKLPQSTIFYQFQIQK